LIVKKRFTGFGKEEGHPNPLLTTEFHAPFAIRDMLINVQSSDFVCEDKSESE